MESFRRGANGKRLDAPRRLGPTAGSLAWETSGLTLSSSFNRDYDRARKYLICWSSEDNCGGGESTGT